MSAPQTSYSEGMAAGVAGMMANQTDYDADTRVVENAGGIGFGLACGQGTNDKGVVLGADQATDFVGVSMRDITVQKTATLTDKYPQYGNAAIVTKGDIFVTVSGAVNAGDNATFVKTTGVLGSIAADATHFLIAGARFMTSAADGGIAVLRLTGELPTT